MKKIIVLIVFVAGIATSGYSQFIKQGTIIAGGSFEFNSHKDNDSDFKRSGLSLMPWAGFMVIDNFAVGGILDVSTSTTESGGSKFTSNSFMAGPFARYYLDNGLFAHGQFTLGGGKTDSGTVQKTSSNELKIGAGYAIRITDTVLLEPILGYMSRSQKDKDTDLKFSESGFFFMGGFTIFINSTN
ncbi:MAG: outer membrane beta-barrel protein [Cyclobacteriaceae bacterium]